MFKKVLILTALTGPMTWAVENHGSKETTVTKGARSKRCSEIPAASIGLRMTLTQDIQTQNTGTVWGAKGDFHAAEPYPKTRCWLRTDKDLGGGDAPAVATLLPKGQKLMLKSAGPSGSVEGGCVFSGVTKHNGQKYKILMVCSSPSETLEGSLELIGKVSTVALDLAKN